MNGFGFGIIALIMLPFMIVADSFNQWKRNLKRRCAMCNEKRKIYKVRITKTNVEYWCANCIREEEEWKNNL